MLISIRRFSTSIVRSKRILPAVDVSRGSTGRSSGERFSNNFPILKKPKAWELTGEDKETYFKRKHAHTHAAEKNKQGSRSDNRYSSRNDKPKQQRLNRSDGRSERRNAGAGRMKDDKPRSRTADRFDESRGNRTANNYESRGGRRADNYESRNHRAGGKKTDRYESRGDRRTDNYGSRNDRFESRGDRRTDNYGSRNDRFESRGDRWSSRNRNQDDFEDRRQRGDKKEVYSGIRASPLSEYIYGHNPVFAALTAQRREYFTRLLVHNPKSEDQEIIDLAKKHEIKVRIAKDKNELNILTNNGVHNGFVLETKPMTPQPIHNLANFNPEKRTFRIEEDFLGDNITKEYVTQNPHPFGVYLDEVSDPHNVGAIVRSAYFLGADFVVVSDKNCAPLSPVVSKTSVGALEFLPVYACSSPLTFLDKSKENGWTVISAGHAGHSKDSQLDQTLNSRKVDFRDLDTFLPKSPVLLVLGSEGKGIRTTMKLKSDYIVGIDSKVNVHPMIDSLNVSVASALLIQKIMDFE